MGAMTKLNISFPLFRSILHRIEIIHDQLAWNKIYYLKQQKRHHIIRWPRVLKKKWYSLLVQAREIREADSEEIHFLGTVVAYESYMQ